MAKLEHRTALVTGASSGLGRALTRWLSARGVKVYATARREAELRSLAAECQDSPGAVIPVGLDVSNVTRTQSELRRLDAECGGLDLVVANAGVGLRTRAKAFDWDNLERTIDVNVRGAAATLTAVLPQMLERGRGHLVGISSIAAFRGMPHNWGYCASKAFLSILLEGLRVDLQGTGISVTAVHPGFFKSEMTAKHQRMPFLLEVEEAAEQVGNAIAKRLAQHTFPWQLASAMAVGRLVPRPAWDKVAKRLG
jgi:NADP-dependent 3-hydroxy acid dehydrogenase YdfG